MAYGSSYPAEFRNADNTTRIGGNVLFTDSTNQPVSVVNPVTSGALTTTTFTSGTGVQASTARQTTVYVVGTGDATGNTGTVTVQLSPDGTTYSTVHTVSIAAALNTLGALGLPITLVVPQSWYVKLTTAHTTLGTATIV